MHLISNSNLTPFSSTIFWQNVSYINFPLHHSEMHKVSLYISFQYKVTKYIHTSFELVSRNVWTTSILAYDSVVHMAPGWWWWWWRWMMMMTTIIIIIIIIIIILIR